MSKCYTETRFLVLVRTSHFWVQQGYYENLHPYGYYQLGMCVCVCV